MSEKNKISPLEEAKLNYEQIQKFAKEQAATQLEEQIAEKLKHIFESKLNEDITININGEDVDVQRDGESVANVSDIQGMDEPGMGLDIEKTTFGEPSEDNDEFMVSDEDDEIELCETIEEIIQNQNIEEMNKMTMEQDETIQAAAPVDAAAVPAPKAGIAPEVGVAPTGEVPAPAPAMPDLLSKLDTLINIMLQQAGGAAEPVEGGATAGSEEEFEVIDDEAPVAAPVAPVQEEEIEITGFDEDRNFIDEMEEQMLEIVDEDNAIEETRSLGFTTKGTGDRNKKMGAMQYAKGHHAPVTSIEESVKNKAQQESRVDELIKENNSLKSTVKVLQSKEKEFEDAFVDLRTQFNEMQLFNGKLALVNKVLMNGGLTTDEKIKICEQFDNVGTYEEASKLFKNIIKENNIKVVGDGKEKLKGSSTNTVQPKSTSEPLYESKEARRAKVLAGMIKTENED